MTNENENSDFVFFWVWRKVWSGLVVVNVPLQWAGVFALIGPALSKIIPLDELAPPPVDADRIPCIIPDLDECLDGLKNSWNHKGEKLHPHLSLANDETFSRNLLLLGKRGFSAKLHSEALENDIANVMSEIKSHSPVAPDFVAIAFSASSDHQWFHAHPAIPGFQMNSSVWRHTMCTTFGLPIWDPTHMGRSGFTLVNAICNCCKKSMGVFAAYAHHAMVCPYLKGQLTRRHNGVCDVYLRWTKLLAAECNTSSNISIAREVPYDDLFPGLRRTPIDPNDHPRLFIYRDRGGNLNTRTGAIKFGDIVVTDRNNPQAGPSVYDVTIVASVITKNNMKNPPTLENLDSKTNNAESKKMAAFQQAFNLDDPIRAFKGAAIESGGAIGKGMHQCISHTANIISRPSRQGADYRDPHGERDKTSRGYVVTQLRQAVQVSLMTGNSHCIHAWITRCCVGNFKNPSHWWYDDKSDSD